MEYNLKRKKSIKSLSMLNSEQTHNFNQHLKCTKARLCIRYRASLTIEAAFVLPLFVFCLALFLGLFRVLGAEVHVEKAVSCATERLAVSGVFEESSANHMLDGAVGNRWIRQILKQEGCPEEYFKNGYQGIFLDLLQSDEKFVRYRARYQINLPMGAFFKQTVSVAIVIEIAVSQCQEIENMAEQVSLVTEFNPVKVLRSEEWMKELLHGLWRNVK